MTDLHIDDFYRDIGRALVLLYGHFPRRMTLIVEDIAGPDTPDEFGLPSPRHEACLQALLWLAQTDYLTFDSLVRQEALDQAVLTHRAFLTLTEYTVLSTHSGDNDADNTNLRLVAPDGPQYIQRIRHELKHGTSFSLAETMREFLARSNHYPLRPAISTRH